jgi:hypothetical protein
VKLLIKLNYQIYYILIDLEAILVMMNLITEIHVVSSTFKHECGKHVAYNFFFLIHGMQ